MRRKGQSVIVQIGNIGIDHATKTVIVLDKLNEDDSRLIAEYVGKCNYSYDESEYTARCEQEKQEQEQQQKKEVNRQKRAESKKRRTKKLAAQGGLKDADYMRTFLPEEQQKQFDKVREDAFADYVKTHNGSRQGAQMHADNEAVRFAKKWIAENTQDTASE